MNSFHKTKSGFTLIELMVVIAIIGLLSSVVLASLGGTRMRARDSAIKQIVGQMRSVMATQYAENPNSPSYFLSNSGWVISNTAGGVFTNNCATKFTNAFFSTQNATALLDLCNQLALQIKQDTGASTLYAYVGATDYTDSVGGGSGHTTPCDVFGQCYTIMVRLPSNSLTYYCASGKQGTPANSSSNGTTAWAAAGCWDNP